MTQTNKPPARLLADVGPILDELAREIEAAPPLSHAFDAGRISTLRRIVDRLERAAAEQAWIELTKGEAEK